MKRLKLLLLLPIVFGGCADQKEVHEVFHEGALQEIMRGEAGKDISLSVLQDKKHAYALGAIAGLKGEIQVLDGKGYISSVSGNEVFTDTTLNKKASLLVYSYVEKWKSIQVPKEVISKEQLETFVFKEAEKNDLNTEEPFAFLLEGSPERTDWHVINWTEGDSEHSHRKHKESGLNGSLYKEELTILGFYSNKHKGIFTHHSTNMHLHFVDKKKKLGGHVDDLKLGEGMILKLPE
ncbi:decarboxylase [Leptobacterium flavescens]|uniref:Alpha-acetolactate decarboxylase n=1 Tax=Leptobacterium flavescens TaxID=472055 RepID=A0A6P0UN59_9FLAO|nr:acetolactate decarboxylase [Leptobacterium flavescens]NER14811.1 decarboxylase [Leptobacterium flavescens]